MAMTWGDALAALIGRRMGRHRYQIWEVSVPGGLGGDVRGERGGNVSGTTTAAWFIAQSHSTPYSAGGALVQQ